jgi:hypothetical protein
LAIVLSVLLRYKDSDYHCGNKSHHGYSCTYAPVQKLTKQNEIWTNLRTNFLIKINPRKIVNYVFIFDASLTISQNHHQHEHDNMQVIISFICMFCWSLFVLLYFFSWPLCCLFFFDIRILITP